MERIQDLLQATSLDHVLAQAVSEDRDQAMRQSLNRLYAAGHLDFLTLLDCDGKVRYRPANPDRLGDSLASISLVRRAMERKGAVAGTILLSAAQLTAEEPKLAERARFDLLPTPAAKPTRDQVRTEGMVMAAVVPIFDDNGQEIGLLFGGKLLNRRNEMVDQITRDVFPEERQEPVTAGTVTIFEQDLRIATNVLDSDGQRALGTRMSGPVFDAVLVRGETWSAPAFVVNDWYITAYRPIRDPDTTHPWRPVRGVPTSPVRASPQHDHGDVSRWCAGLHAGHPGAAVAGHELGVAPDRQDPGHVPSGDQGGPGGTRGHSAAGRVRRSLPDGGRHGPRPAGARTEVGACDQAAHWAQRRSWLRSAVWQPDWPMKSTIRSPAC